MNQRVKQAILIGLIVGVVSYVIHYKRRVMYEEKANAAYKECVANGGDHLICLKVMP